MNNGFAVRVLFVREIVAIAELLPVVDLAVEDEREVRISGELHRLHAERQADDGEAIKGETRASKGGNRLDRECVRTSMSHLHCVQAESFYVGFCTEHGPNAAHVLREIDVHAQNNGVHVTRATR